MGVFRFLTKAWNLGEELKDLPSKDGAEESKDLRRLVHKTTRSVETDITEFGFNTAVSSLMVLLTAIEKEKSTSAFKTFLLLLHPFAPHLSSELWENLKFSSGGGSASGGDGALHEQSWPPVIDEYIQEEEITLVVQVNGRVRDTVLLPAGLSASELTKAAEELENVKKYLANKKIK